MPETLFVYLAELWPVLSAARCLLQQGVRAAVCLKKACPKATPRTDMVDRNHHPFRVVNGPIGLLWRRHAWLGITRLSPLVISLSHYQN